jgi:Tfp pilus assembly ATPase PilU
MEGRGGGQDPLQKLQVKQRGRCCITGGTLSGRSAALPIVMQYLNFPMLTDLTLQIICY